MLGAIIGRFSGEAAPTSNGRTGKTRQVTDLSYREDIDGLRAIAVLAVLGFHLAPDLVRGGFVGVDIFFVISGFLISSIIYKALESGTFSIGDFYIRRIRRIFPALFLVLIFVCLVGWFLLLPTAYVHAGQQVVGGSAFVANFVLWCQSGYFSPDAVQKPLLHLWSLGVEEQFYFIFPLACIAFYRAESRWNLSAVFLAIGAASMVLNVALVTRYRDAVYFLPFSRLWELFLGAGLALYQQREVHSRWDSRRLSQRWRNAMGILGLALLAASIVGISESDPFPGWRALLPTVGTVLVIAAGRSSWVNRRILSWKPAVFVGLISYPLYLWHWPIISFQRTARVVWGYMGTNQMIWGVDLCDVVFGSTTVLGSFALAYLTYRFVELPIRQVKDREIRRRGAMRLLYAVALTGAFAVLIIVKDGFPARVPPAMDALDHDYITDADLSYRVGSCLLRPDQSPDAFSDNCLDPAPKSAAAPFVLVWGDSHAADLMPGFRALQRGSGVRLAQYTTASCAPILGRRVGSLPFCQSVNDAVIARIRILKPDIVVLSARWDESLGVGHDNADCAEKLPRTIQMIKAAGVRRVVVIGSAPVWKRDVPTLLFHEIRLNPDHPAPHRLARNLLKEHDDSLLMAITRRGGADFISIFDKLCDPSSCAVTDGPGWKDVLTGDAHHFTEHGSVQVAQSIWPSILHPGGGEVMRNGVSAELGSSLPLPVPTP